MQILLGIILLVAIVVLMGVFFRYLLKKEYIKQHVHPVTGTKDFFIFFDFLRIFLFLIAVIGLYILTNLLIGLFSSLLFFIHIYAFSKKNSRNPYGELIFTWEYSDDELKVWKEKFENVKSGFISRTTTSKMIYFTDAFVFFSKHKKISIKKQPFDQLTLVDVSLKDNFIVFHYGLNDIVMKRHFILIPKGKKKEANSLILSLKK